MKILIKTCLLSLFIGLAGCTLPDLHQYYTAICIISGNAVPVLNHVIIKTTNAVYNEIYFNGKIVIIEGQCLFVQE